LPRGAAFGRPVSLRSLGSASLRKPNGYYGDRPSLDRANGCRPQRSQARTSAVDIRHGRAGRRAPERARLARGAKRSRASVVGTRPTSARAIY